MIEAREIPFRHWVLDDSQPEILMRRAAHAVPPADWPGWVRYSSALESNKRTCRDFDQLPEAIIQLVCRLASIEFTKQIRELTGIGDLIPAPFCHGGGLHVTDPGGELGCHIDFAVHPDAPFLERRVSAILYLDDWQTGWGGELELWDVSARHVEARHSPAFNRLVVFENSDWSYHSVSPIVGPRPRSSIAVYFCAPTRPGVTRRRALWVPSR